MRLPDDDEQLIRRFLLGDLPEDEHDQVEDRIFSHADFEAHVLIVEDELVEDYAARRLSGDERKQFEAQLLQTPEQRQKLGVVNALMARAREERTARPQWTGWRAGLLSLVKHPVIATLCVCVAFLGALLAVRMYRSFSVAATVERLNQPVAIAQMPATSLLSVPLAPGKARSLGPTTTIAPAAPGTIVQFHLKLQRDEYERYGVALHTGEKREVFRIDPLPSHSSTAPGEVVLYVPSSALSVGTYVLTLTGSRGTSPPVTVGEYYFKVD